MFQRFIRMKGLIWEDETGSHPVTIEIPEELKAKAQELHDHLIEEAVLKDEADVECWSHHTGGVRCEGCRGIE